MHVTNLHIIISVKLLLLLVLTYLDFVPLVPIETITAWRKILIMYHVGFLLVRGRV